jgi:NTP pyrophosphatase (non-canonical NTP hydrolase)
MKENFYPMVLTDSEKQRLLAAFHAMNDAAKIINKIAVEKGFWDKPDAKEKLLLIHTEISEVVEALRKETPEKDKHLKEYLNHDVEVADVLIRLLDYAYQYCPGYFPQIVAEKVIYNASRPVMHGGKRF